VKITILLQKDTYNSVKYTYYFVKKRQAMQYFVYIVKCSDKTLYTGITTDLYRRVDEHNSSDKGAKYTKVRRPVALVYFEQYEDRSSASKREYEIKKLSRNKKLALVDKKIFSEV